MVRSLNLQACMGIDHCHSCAAQHGVLHPGNILLELSENMEPCVRIADFGASAVLKDCGCRPFRGELCALPYRPPENLLHGDSCLRFDMWSIGCIVAETALNKCLFGPLDGTQWGTLMAIFQLVGTPTDESWPGFSALPQFSKEIPSFALCYLKSRHEEDFFIQSMIEDTKITICTF